MLRRIGWWALAGVAALGLASTAIGGAWQVGLAIRDDDLGLAVRVVALGLVGLLFWKWIALGAWQRAHPELDPDTGEPVEPDEPIGPWGVVGRVLLVLVVAGLGTAIVWGTIATRRVEADAERVRERAEAEALRVGLTVADVRDAQRARQVWFVDQRGPDPVAALLVVPGATVGDVSVTDGDAAILLLPDESPPCAVVTIDADAHVDSRLTTNC